MNNFFITLFAMCGFGVNTIAATPNALLTRIVRTFGGKPFTFAIESATDSLISVVCTDLVTNGSFAIKFHINGRNIITKVEFQD